MNKSQTGLKNFQLDLAGVNGMCEGSGFVEWKQTSADSELTGAWKVTQTIGGAATDVGWHAQAWTRMTARPR